MPGVAARLPGVSVRDPARSVPAVHVAVTRFGVWRAAVAVAVAVVWLVVIAWVVSHAMAGGGLPPVAVGAVAVVALATAVVFGWRLAAVRPFALRWDGASWSVSPMAALPAAADGVPGDVVVMLDFGQWLLLRFTPEHRATAAVPTWLPLQRLGHEPAWHALRCAVYAPRPGAAGDAPAADR